MSTALDVDAMIAKYHERQGLADRAGALPGWALVLQSPYRDHTGATSWIGGFPNAPEGFTWPRDASGKPLHFLAQIDLSALTDEPETGAVPPGLPRSGAMLIFFGHGQSVAVFDADQMAFAAPVEPPADTAPLSASGFWTDARVFARWPVDPIAYIDTDGERPDFMEPRFAAPRDWIDTAGLAALETDLVIETLERDIRRISDSAQHAMGETGTQNDKAALASAAPHLGDAPDVIEELAAFRAAMRSRPGTDPVDPDAFEACHRARQSLARGMAHTATRRLLEGDANAVWNRLLLDYPALRQNRGFADLPEAYHGFVEARITDWRGHRLFGLEAPPPHNEEDLRGRDCLVTVSADPIFGTETEHHYGLSIWCPREEMAEGRTKGGIVLRHESG